MSHSNFIESIYDKLCGDAKRDKEEIEQLKKKISLLEDEIAELDMKNRKLESAMNHNVRFDDIA
jgi:hypothetical protein